MEEIYIYISIILGPRERSVSREALGPRMYIYLLFGYLLYTGVPDDGKFLSGGILIYLYLKYSLKIHKPVANHVSHNMSREVTLYLIKLNFISILYIIVHPN